MAASKSINSPLFMLREVRFELLLGLLSWFESRFWSFVE
jgi:hypothetical protein